MSRVLTHEGPQTKTGSLNPLFRQVRLCRTLKDSGYRVTDVGRFPANQKSALYASSKAHNMTTGACKSTEPLYLQKTSFFDASRTGHLPRGTQSLPSAGSQASFLFNSLRPPPTATSFPPSPTHNPPPAIKQQSSTKHLPTQPTTPAHRKKSFQPLLHVITMARTKQSTFFSTSIRKHQPLIYRSASLPVMLIVRCSCP